MPEKAQKCMESWKKYLPDYEIIHWDFSKFPKGKSVWVDQAFNSGKYAFAADYIRLFALYNYGGIYLDTDVEVLKPYDDLLDLPYFIGQEKTPSGIEAATIGFTPGHSLIKQLLDRYDNRSFIKSDGSLDMEPIPYIIRRYIDAQYEYNVISNIAEFSNNPQKFNVFSADFFSPKRYDTGDIEITENTYSIHDFAGSWMSADEKSENAVPIRKAGFRAKIGWHLLLRKHIVVISDNYFDSLFARKFFKKTSAPLGFAYFSKPDLIKLYNCVRNNADLKVLHFIPRDKARRKDILDGYYPIATVEGTDIEIHLKGCFSREQASDLWDSAVSSIPFENSFFIKSGSDQVTRKDFYKVCFLINMNKKLIQL